MSKNPQKAVTKNNNVDKWPKPAKTIAGGKTALKKEVANTQADDEKALLIENRKIILRKACIQQSLDLQKIKFEDLRNYFFGDEIKAKDVDDLQVNDLNKIEQIIQHIEKQSQKRQQQQSQGGFSQSIWSQGMNSSFQKQCNSVKWQDQASPKQKMRFQKGQMLQQIEFGNKNYDRYSPYGNSIQQNGQDTYYNNKILRNEVQNLKSILPQMNRKDIRYHNLYSNLDDSPNVHSSLSLIKQQKRSIFIIQPMNQKDIRSSFGSQQELEHFVKKNSFSGSVSQKDNTLINQQNQQFFILNQNRKKNSILNSPLNQRLQNPYNEKRDKKGDRFMNSRDKERNKYYDLYIKSDQTQRKLQSLKMLATIETMDKDENSQRYLQKLRSINRNNYSVEIKNKNDLSGIKNERFHNDSMDLINTSLESDILNSNIKQKMKQNQQLEQSKPQNELDRYISRNIIGSPNQFKRYAIQDYFKNSIENKSPQQTHNFNSSLHSGSPNILQNQNTKFQELNQQNFINNIIQSDLINKKENIKKFKTQFQSLQNSLKTINIQKTKIQLLPICKQKIEKNQDNLQVQEIQNIEPTEQKQGRDTKAKLKYQQKMIILNQKQNEKVLQNSFKQNINLQLQDDIQSNKNEKIQMNQYEQKQVMKNNKIPSNKSELNIMKPALQISPNQIAFEIKIKNNGNLFGQQIEQNSYNGNLQMKQNNKVLNNKKYSLHNYYD